MGQKFRDRQAKAELSKKGANSMAMTGLDCRNDLVGTGRAISGLLGIHGVTKHAISPCMASISSIQGRFFWQVGIS